MASLRDQIDDRPRERGGFSRVQVGGSLPVHSVDVLFARCRPESRHCAVGGPGEEVDDADQGAIPGMRTFGDGEVEYDVGHGFFTGLSDRCVRHRLARLHMAAGKLPAVHTESLVSYDEDAVKFVDSAGKSRQTLRNAEKHEQILALSRRSSGTGACARSTDVITESMRAAKFVARLRQWRSNAVQAVGGLIHHGAVCASTIRHVLFDADGVLQIVPGGWYAAMEPYLGDRAREFLHRTWNDELPTLVGNGDYLPMLAAALAEYGVTEPVDDVYRAVWHRIERIEESCALVRALRRNGYGVHLGTNQEQHRGGHMRTVLGYDDLFDTSCYSYELGVAKPDPAFFAEAARRIGADPSSILFIDDSVRNVEGARAAGLEAVVWDVEQGPEALVELLADYGVNARMTA